MSPPGGPRPFHGNFDCAKMDFTTLLAEHHVERNPPPQEKVGHYSDPAVAKRNTAAMHKALDAAKVSIKAIASHRPSRGNGRPPDTRWRSFPEAA